MTIAATATEARRAAPRMPTRLRRGTIAPHLALCLAYGFVAATVLIL